MQSSNTRYDSVQYGKSSDISGNASRAKKGAGEVCIRFLFVFLLSILCLPSAVGQVLYGTLVGNVTDATQSATPGASVTATEVSTGITETVSTDKSGIYRFTDLKAGTYSVVITAPQFAKFVSNGVSIQTNEATRIDGTLQPAAVTQTVEVTSAPPALQTDSATVTSELEAKQLETVISTPGVGMRNFQKPIYGSARFYAGFTPSATDHSESGNPSDTLFVNANGVSGSNNDTRIDGVSDIYP